MMQVTHYVNLPTWLHKHSFQPYNVARSVLVTKGLTVIRPGEENSALHYVSLLVTDALMMIIFGIDVKFH